MNRRKLTPEDYRENNDARFDENDKHRKQRKKSITHRIYIAGNFSQTAQSQMIILIALNTPADRIEYN